MTTGSSDRERLDRIVNELGRVPTHAVLRQLCAVARKSKSLPTKSFRRLVAFLLDEADGKDRRHPSTTRAGDVRPVSRLRIAVEDCFGIYADLHWFNLNKTANALGGPVNGFFPRMAMNLGRVRPEAFAQLVTAMMSDTPDAAFLRLLQQGRGRVPGVGVHLFSQIVKQSVRFAEAPGYRMPLALWRRELDGARQYRELAEEVLNGQG